MRVVLPIRIYCDDPECAKHFEVEVPLSSLCLSGNPMEFNYPHSFDPPQGWGTEDLVLCPEHNPYAGKEVAPEKIVDRARKLQALAINKGATQGERDNAWAEFTKIWQQYILPDDIGFER